MKTNTLEDLLKFCTMFKKTDDLHIVPNGLLCLTLGLPRDRPLSKKDFMQAAPRVVDGHVLCTKDADGKFRPVTQLFVPFDKERAPLTNNLLVYINGQILWDNVRLAQRAKG